MDFPLAPEAKHPVPVESVLSAMAFIRSEYDISDMVVIMDSAGGCLATNAVAAISNTFAFSFRLYKTPRIDKVVLLYPILDNDSWRPHRWPESRIESWKLFVQRRTADSLSLSTSYINLTLQTWSQFANKSIWGWSMTSFRLSLCVANFIR
jgi:acetyl esterase/lipase